MKGKYRWSWLRHTQRSGLPLQVKTKYLCMCGVWFWVLSALLYVWVKFPRHIVMEYLIHFTAWQLSVLVVSFLLSCGWGQTCLYHWKIRASALNNGKSRSFIQVRPLLTKRQKVYPISSLLCCNQAYIWSPSIWMRTSVNFGSYFWCSLSLSLLTKMHISFSHI